MAKTSEIDTISFPLTRLDRKKMTLRIPKIEIRAHAIFKNLNSCPFSIIKVLKCQTI